MMEMLKPRKSTALVGVLAGILMFLLWFAARPPDCAFGAPCPVADTAIFANNIGLQGESAFTVTLDTTPTASRTHTIPDMAGNRTFAFLEEAQAWTADQTFNDNVNATFGTGGDADIFYNTTHLVIDPQVVGAGSIIPGGNDGGGLGISGTAFSDLFLASGAVIDFNASNVLITHSAGVLTIEADVNFTEDAGRQDVTLLSALNNSLLRLNRAQGTVGVPTSIANGADLGIIEFRGYTTAQYRTGAEIRGAVSAAIVGDEIPSTLEFMTTADGANTPTLRWSITHAGVLESNGAQSISTTAGTLTFDPAADIVLSPSGIAQNYNLSDRSTLLTIQGQSAGQTTGFELSANDGDGTDSVLIRIVGVGTPGAMANAEYLAVRWEPGGSTYDIGVVQLGGGALRTFRMFDGANVWLTKATGGGLTFDPTTDVLVANGKGLVVGHTGQIVGPDTAEFQVLGTGSPDGRMTVAVWNNSVLGPIFNFTKSNGVTIGALGIVSDDDLIGSIEYTPDDGTDVRHQSAFFQAEVDDATPAANDVGTAFVWRQQPGGGPAVRETMRLDAAGLLTLAVNGLTFTTASSISTTAGDLTLDAAASLNVTLTDGDVDALTFADSTNNYYNIDTRTTTATAIAHTFDAADVTLASGAAAVFGLVRFTGHTVNLTGNTQVTAFAPMIDIESVTLAADGVPGALTIDEATALRVRAPREGANVVLTDTSALFVRNALGDPVNQYGVKIEDLTSGGSDYGIYIAGSDTYAIWVDADSIRLDSSLWVEAAPTEGAAGEQLTSGGAGAVMTWAAAASRREDKVILGEAIAPQDALDRLLNTTVYDFKYKPGRGTEDVETIYTGVMADDAPWAMHYDGGILNPVNTFGYTVQAVKALQAEIDVLEEANTVLEARLDRLEALIETQ